MKKAILYPLLFAVPLISIAKGEVHLKQQPKPHVFIENKGQMDNHNIDFKIESNGVAVFLESGQLHYLWTKPNTTNAVGANTVEAYRMDVHLLGANTNAKVITEGEQQYYERYFYPSEITAHSYSKIIYKDIYPNIDWVLYTSKTPGSNTGLEYDFIVHHGGNVKDIRLKYDGAISLNLQEGRLVAHTPFGNVAEHKPYTYISESKKMVESSFSLSDNVISFNVAKAKGTLVIDPVILWATYYGDALVDVFYSLASDAGGNVYAAGYTRSMNSIATTGAFQMMLDGVQDAMLVKFDASGQRLWGTYYGGTGATDMFRSVVCDAAGNIYAAGQTNSVLGIHTTGAHDTTVNGTDAMLVKFNSAGQRLWGTYYGGTGGETPAYVTCDKNYNIYLCGSTNSTTGIASSGLTVHDTTYTASGTNGFLVKFDSAGVRQWGTYYGAGLTEFLTISCDSSGNVFAGGTTRATAGIHTAGAHDTSLGSPGFFDGFLVKFNTNGLRQWGTYYGGRFADDIRTVSEIKKGHIYIAGSTRSDSSIATPGSFRDTVNNLSTSDAFIAKISTDSGKLKWGTYYGGNLNDAVYGIAMNTKDKIFLTGGTASTNDITTSPSHQQAYGGGISDAFLLVLDTNGYRHYSSYLGGLGVENGWAVKSTGNGNIFIAGETSSSSGIATTGSHKDTLTGFSDGFLAKFLEDQISISRPFPDSALCPGDFLQIGFTTSTNFNTGNSYNVELSDTAGSFLVPLTIGSLNGIGDGIISCQIPFDVKGGSQYSIRIKATNPAYISTDKITGIQIKQGPHKPEIITNAPFCEGHFLSLYAGGTIAGASYAWIGPDNFYYNMQSFTYGTTKLKDAGVFTVTATMNGCSAKDTADVKIYAKSEVLKPTSNSPVCDGGQLILSATGTPVPGVGYIWTGPNGFIDTAINPMRNAISLNAAGVYTVAVDTADLKGCGADTTTVAVTELPKVTAANNGPIDEGEKLMLTATGSAPNLMYDWTGPDSFQSTFQNPEINDVTTSAIGVYIVKVSINACDGFDTTIVVVNKIAKSEFKMSPNPSYGSLTLAGTVLSEQAISLAIINSFGQVVYSDEIATNNLAFNKTLKITSLPNGVYQVKLKMDNEIKGYEFVLIQQ